MVQRQLILLTNGKAYPIQMYVQAISQENTCTILVLKYFSAVNEQAGQRNLH